MAAIRYFNYTITENSISPETIAKGGVQGEHNATQINFNMTTEFQNILKEKSGDKRFYYRFDGYDGAGKEYNFDSNEFDPRNKSEFSFLVDFKLTRAGGIAEIKLIITIADNTGEKTEAETITHSVKLALKSARRADSVTGESFNSVSTLAEIAKNNAKIAEAAREFSENAAERTENAKAFLEKGSCWVFDGGGASGKSEIDIKSVIDGEMSDSSINPVQNRVVKQYIDILFANIGKQFHPIGSLYISSKPTEPSELFGGEWERIKDKFILSAGDDFEVGNSGGSVEHSHLIDPDKVFARVYRSTDIYYDWKRNEDTETWTASEAVAVGETGEITEVDGGVGVYGNTDSANNLPPYEVFYCWKRIR